MDIGTILLTTALAILGWVGGFITAVKAADRSARQQVRYQRLADAWLMLESQASLFDTSRRDGKSLESAVAIIQLYGTPELVKQAHRFIREFADTGGANILDLLNSIRTELNSLQGGEPSEMLHLRIQDNEVKGLGSVKKGKP